MPELTICVQCNEAMSRYETVIRDGRRVEIDWSMEPNPRCRRCRGLPSEGPIIKRDVLGGFAWKRDKDGKKVPK